MNISRLFLTVIFVPEKDFQFATNMFYEEGLVHPGSITSFSQEDKVIYTMRSLVAFFSLSYILSWIIWLPLYLPYWNINSLPVLPYHHAIGALGPMIAAFILTGRTEGKKGILNLLKAMLDGGRFFWLLIALLSPFILFFLASILNYFINDATIRVSGIGKTNEFPKFNLLTYFISLLSD